MDHLPEEMRAVNQWHCWRLENKNGRITKMPYQLDGKAAKANDPTTWTDFASAVDASQYYSGLAFELSEPWTGIDIDDCIGPNGVKLWAMKILSRFMGVGYAEVSPSGTGIKIITRARKPDGMSCQRKIEDGQIEVYDHGRFWCITGDTYAGELEIGDGQAAVNWINETYFKDQKPEPEPKPAPTVYLPPLSSGDALMRRVESYLLSIPGSGEGSRNSSAFRLAGNLRAFDDNGRRLDEATLIDFMRGWNKKNTPPLHDEELLAAIRSSATNGTPRATKPDRPRIEPQADISAIVNGDLAKLCAKPADEIDDQAFAASMIPECGLLREVFEYYWQSANRQYTVFGLGTAVAFCETVFGHRVRSHTDLRTNDYNVLLAPAAGGKDAALKVPQRLFAAAGDTSFLTGGKPQSGNGLLDAVSRNPCSILCQDEFGKFLASIVNPKASSHQSAIRDYLLELYTSSADIFQGNSHANGQRHQIAFPHLCILGASTWDFFDSLNCGNVLDGLLPRFAFWPVRDGELMRDDVNKVPADGLVARVRSWIDFRPVSGNLGVSQPVTVRMAPDALERWQTHYRAIDLAAMNEFCHRSSIWGRAGARTMKLALVHRCQRLAEPESSRSCVIELQDVDWAIRLSNWLARTSCDILAEAIPNTGAVKLIDFVRNKMIERGTMTSSELNRTRKSVPASEFKAAALALEAMNFLVVTQEKTTGRPVTRYTIAVHT